MYRRNLLATFIAVVLFGVICGTAAADFPLHWVVWFNIREEPMDPKSGIIFVIELNLEAVNSDGDWVGWEIRSVEFRKPGTVGHAVWVEDSPRPQTPDGLWWIKHADPERPVLSEFLLPPLLEGVATAQDSENEGLEYTVEGVPYVPEREGKPALDLIAALDYEFAVLGQRSPPEQGNDEPVEPGGGGDPQ